MKKQFLVLIMAGVLFILVPCQGFSQPHTPFENEARDRLALLIDEALVLIRDPLRESQPAKYQEKLYNRALEIFDFKTFSMLSLGRKYRSFSPVQKADFTHYFSKLISETYFSRLAGQDVDNIQVSYQEQTPLKQRKKAMKTDITTRLTQGDAQVKVTYRMIKKDSSDWKIYDVLIAGVSMAANYREQFRQDVSASPERIIQNLKEKVKAP